MKKGIARKIFALIFASALLLAASCGGAGDSGSPSGSPPPSQDASPSQAQPDTRAGTPGDAASGEPIKLGMLWGLVGACEQLDTYCRDAALLAVEKVNAEGGINGRPLEVIIEDYASDPDTTTQKAKKLVLQDEVVAILGTTLGSCFEAAKPVVEDNDSLLIYPTIAFGEQTSENVVYTGGTSYGQTKDAVEYFINEKGIKKIFLLGSDYSYPVTINRQVRAIAAQYPGVEIVGEEYLPIPSTDFASVINKIKASGADFIYYNMVADSLAAGYKQFEQYGINYDDITVVSVITADPDALLAGPAITGTYSTFSYFHTLDNDKNAEFLRLYADKYGEEQAAKVGGTPEASYLSVLMLADALRLAGDDLTPQNIKSKFAGMTVDSPQGAGSVDPETFYLTTKTYLARWDGNMQPEIVFESEDAKAEVWPALLYPDGAP
ncbi:MAG: transporter substrate-binding protein [Oscillospiraceae bacterium]|jgi:urea transport system substrate-binding protein|nr:transporter substrate-binding protein [Oscillospiraceae bacterium]